MKGMRLEGLERLLDKMEHGKIVYVDECSALERQIERKRSANDERCKR